MALLPTALFLVVLAWFLVRNRGRLVVQIYAVIVASYLNIFPAIDYLFSVGDEMRRFALFQAITIYFFELPLLLMLNRVGKFVPPSIDGNATRMRLSPLFPLILLGMLAGFWYVAIEYDMLFLRLLSVTGVPTLPRYLYRTTLETSFFVVMFLSYVLTSASAATRFYRLYQLTLFAYLGTFLFYFVINSRMQLLVLIFCALCTRPKISAASTRTFKMAMLGLLAVTLVIGHTLVRELYVEETGRLETAAAADLLSGMFRLIAIRLDSVAILYPLSDSDFNPLAFHLSGLQHVVNLNVSFFVDPETFADMRESEVTSSSVEVINRLLSQSYVDFPKSMVIDVFLTFGLIGLPVAAILLGRSVCVIQRQSRRFGHFDLVFVTAIYAMPMLLQFEKETMGFLVSFIKWSPILFLAYCLRPRARRPAISSYDSHQLARLG